MALKHKKQSVEECRNDVRVVMPQQFAYVYIAVLNAQLQMNTESDYDIVYVGL